MNITSAQYDKQINGSDKTIIAEIDGQKMFVPINPDNRHYQAIQEWVAKGNKIEEAD